MISFGLNKWFWGKVTTSGVWATSQSMPSINIIVRNYECAQHMDECWVAFLGRVPDIEAPTPITTKDVIEYLNQDTLPPNPKSAYYKDRDLANMVTGLFEAAESLEQCKRKIRARANSTTT